MHVAAAVLFHVAMSAAATAGVGRRIVLGSGSATRRAILAEVVGADGFEVIKPDIDEKAIRHADPAELVLALGKAKAAALLEGERGVRVRAPPAALVLTADQVVVCDGKILEKPRNEAEARAFIAGYARSPAETVGSCVLTDAATGEQWAKVDRARVHFSPVPEASVDAMIAEGGLFHCAGGLMVEHPLVSPCVTRMEGTMDAVQGLKKATLEAMLATALGRPLGAA